MNIFDCEHEYGVLEEDIEIVEHRFLGESEAEIELSGYAVFYCKKCLDIQKKVL